MAGRHSFVVSNRIQKPRNISGHDVQTLPKQKRLGRARLAARSKRARIFFHPDYTVGTGILASLKLQRKPGTSSAPLFLYKNGYAEREGVAGYTAGGEFHPAPKNA